MSERVERIRAALASLNADHIDVIDESANHSARRGAQSHVRVVVVAAAFEGRSRVECHRRINEALAEELASGLHALAIEAITPAQWEARGGARLQSPACAGLARHDAQQQQQQQQQQRLAPGQRP